MLLLGWGGVGWGEVGWGGVGNNNVHVPVHTHTGTATGTALSSSATDGGVGWGEVRWGGIITFMFLYTHRHGNRHCSFIISYCWGAVGWDGI